MKDAKIMLLEELLKKDCDLLTDTEQDLLTVLFADSDILDYLRDKLLPIDVSEVIAEE